MGCTHSKRSLNPSLRMAKSVVANGDSQVEISTLHKPEPAAVSVPPPIAIPETSIMPAIEAQPSMISEKPFKTIDPVVARPRLLPQVQPTPATPAPTNFQYEFKFG